MNIIKFNKGGRAFLVFLWCLPVLFSLLSCHKHASFNAINFPMSPVNGSEVFHEQALCPKESASEDVSYTDGSEAIAPFYACMVLAIPVCHIVAKSQRFQNFVSYINGKINQYYQQYLSSNAKHELGEGTIGSMQRTLSIAHDAPKVVPDASLRGKYVKDACLSGLAGGLVCMVYTLPVFRSIDFSYFAGFFCLAWLLRLFKKL